MAFFASKCWLSAACFNALMMTEFDRFEKRPDTGVGFNDIAGIDEAKDAFEF